MIRKVNRMCESLNKRLGISLTLPKPSKKALKQASICNFVVGTCLVATGSVIKSKWCIIFGTIGIASGAILLKGKENKD